MQRALEVQEATKDISTVKIFSMMKRFIEFLDVSEQSARSYNSGIKQFIKFISENEINSPNREDVLMFKKSLIMNGKKSSTIALYLSALRRFFNWTETENLYPNIMNGVKSPKQEKGHKRDYLSGVQISGMLKTANLETLEGKRNYAMLALMSTCGLRTIEIVRADAGDLREIDGQACLFVQGKGRNSKSEFVKLSAPVLEAVKNYLQARGQASEDEPLFVSCSRRNKGQRLTTRTVSGVAKTAMRSAGYDSPRLTAHSLRHSAATLALQAGMALQEVSEFMRHSNISVTMVYVHSVNRLNSKCEEAVSKAIFAA